MNLLAAVERELQAQSERGLTRRLRTADSPCAPDVRIDGRPVLAFCSNDYLGLASHPSVIDALREGASLYGAGSGASHLISGHSRAHALLEERLADFVAPHLEQARALYFSTGYMANLGLLTAMATVAPDTEIYSEALNHASLIDGARLSRAAVRVYPHADVEALETMLAASTSSNKLVVTDSVFSMDGTIAPLRELLQLCEKYNAWLIVDDAHGFGVLGEHGRGALEHCGLSSSRLIYMGTLGKAAGVSGAFVAAHASVIELLLQRARTYIYTTASSPALAHALQSSMDIIAGEQGKRRRAHLNALIAQFGAALKLQRWQQIASPTAVQPVVIGPNDVTVRVSQALYEQGYWVPAIRPPTVPAGTARLRITLSAAHATESVASLAAALNALEAA